MRAIVLTDDLPFPLSHGGKVDSWNRLLAFKENNVEIFLISWHKIHEVPATADIRSVENVVSHLHLLPYAVKLKRAVGMLQYPSLVAARILGDTDYKVTLKKARDFSAHFVFIDRIFAGETGLRIAGDLSLPVSVRLHNVEHQYISGQLGLATGIYKKLQLFATLLHLKKFETNLLRKADHFFDISEFDLRYWQNQGFTNGHWLPSFLLHKKAINTDDLHQENIYDVGFAGNLHTANNVSGLLWFIINVLPLVKKSKPTLKVVIMGSNPDKAIIEACNSNQISLIANPVVIDTYLSGVAVVINPVKFSSGVNIKMVDMLFRDNQVVTTTEGIRGMPEDVNQIFFIADTPIDFCNAIVDVLLNRKTKSLVKRKLLSKTFDGSLFGQFIPIMASKKSP